MARASCFTFQPRPTCGALVLPIVGELHALMIDPMPVLAPTAGGPMAAAGPTSFSATDFVALIRPNALSRSRV